MYIKLPMLDQLIHAPVLPPELLCDGLPMAYTFNLPANFDFSRMESAVVIMGPDLWEINANHPDCVDFIQSLSGSEDNICRLAPTFLLFTERLAFWFWEMMGRPEPDDVPSVSFPDGLGICDVLGVIQYNLRSYLIMSDYG